MDNANISPELPLSPEQIKNANETAITVACRRICQLFEQGKPLNCSLELMSASGKYTATMKTSESISDRNSTSRNLQVIIAIGEEEVAARIFSCHKSRSNPSIVKITSYLDVNKRFKRLGIGSALLSQDESFQKIAASLYAIVFPDVTTARIVYSDGSEGEDSGWTDRRMNARGLKADKNGVYSETLTISNIARE